MNSPPSGSHTWREFCVVDAQAADAAAITRLQNQLFHQKWSEESIATLLTEAYSLAFIAHAQPMSSASETTAGYLISMKTADTAEIVSIGVASAHQGKGLGQFLVNTYISACRNAGIKEIFLEVAHVNQAAISLYKATGFQICGQRDRYYRASETSSSLNALILSQELS